MFLWGIEMEHWPYMVNLVDMGYCKAKSIFTFKIVRKSICLQRKWRGQIPFSLTSMVLLVSYPTAILAQL